MVATEAPATAGVSSLITEVAGGEEVLESALQQVTIDAAKGLSSQEDSSVRLQSTASAAVH